MALHGVSMRLCHAVVDWNPSGAAILATYRYGSQRMREAALHTVPGLRWLAARGALLHGVPNLALQVQCIKSLKSTRWFAYKCAAKHIVTFVPGCDMQSLCHSS